MEDNKVITSKYLVKENEIRLDSEIIIGEVNFLDVNENHFLVTDRISNNVYLFDNRTGIVNKKLSVEECQPGVKLRPLQANYDLNGNILLLNSIPWGFYFDTVGKCLNKLDKQFIAPSLISFLDKNRIVGFYNELTPYISIMNNQGVNIRKLALEDIEYKNFVYRFNGGGLDVDNDGYIYFLLTYDNIVYKYDENLKLIARFNVKSRLFRKIEKDFSSDPTEIIKNIGKIMQGKSNSHSLFVTNKYLIVQFFHNNSDKGLFELVVCDKKGNRLNKDDIIINSPLLQVNNNKLYFTKNQNIDPSGNIPNPTIDIYSIKIN
jgi:hypothetical protein